MQSRNQEIRLKIRRSGVLMADLAEEMQIGTSTLYYRLQRPLTKAQEDQILQALERCARLAKW